MKVFILEQALLKKPFGKKVNGKIIKAKKFHVVPDEFEDDFPVKVLFEDNSTGSFKKNSDYLQMLPESKVLYGNYKEDPLAVCTFYGSLDLANQFAKDRVHVIKMTKTEGEIPIVEILEV